MSENVYSKISDKLKSITERIATSHKRKYEDRKSQSEYWNKIEKDAEQWRSLLNDNRYPCGERFLNETITKLNAQMKSILSGNISNFSKEEIIYKVAILSGQISIVEYILNEPERVIDLLKEKV